MVDIGSVGYGAELVAEDGSVYSLDGALLSLSWEERKGELAQRASLSAANMAMGGTWLMALAKIGCPLRIFAGWGASREPVFEGTVWEWDYSSATDKVLSLAAYDPLIRLQRSRDFRHYPAGLSTRDIIGDICGDWGIPFDYEWRRSLTHGKKAFRAERLGDMVFGLLDEVSRETGEGYVASFRGGRFLIGGYGSNPDVYRFDFGNAASTGDRLSADGLMTRAKVMGKQDDDGRSPVEAVLDGDLRFGVLQEIVMRDGDASVGAAMAEARALLDRRGKPEESIMLDVPDLPFVRKGDAVEVEAGNLIGLFFVEGVEHVATDRRMSLSLSRATE